MKYQQIFQMETKQDQIKIKNKLCPHVHLRTLTGARAFFTFLYTYKHRKGPKRTEKDRKGPKRTEKGPKRTEKGPKRTEKHVITYYLPKRRENVAEGGQTTGQPAGH